MGYVTTTIFADEQSNWDFGLRQGRAMKSHLLLQYYEKQLKKINKRSKTDVDRARKLFLRYAPGVWAEMEGLAEGLKWPFVDVLHLFGGYRADWKASGCSAYTSAGIYARNYDYHPKTYENRLVFWKPAKGYASVGPAQRLIGRMDGMNEKGLAVGYHFIHRLQAGEGFLCTTITRLLLESCASVEEAIVFLKEIPHRHSFIYSLADRFHHSALVEASPRKVAVFSGEALVCANHFAAPSMQDENRRVLTHSQERLDVLKGLPARMKVDEAYQRFTNPKHGIFQDQYANWAGTIHTSVYDTTKLTLSFGLGPNQPPARLSLKEWLNGSVLPEGVICGWLPTDFSFPADKASNTFPSV
ncbi:acyl-CoA--6-aminopenicillanic acid acyl-transferase [Bacillaceae bacterium SIJ1]|uniref:C45 family autoproteolytic acyltransferase/hydolase n=1 Tax=Litoribacterium kuwaitense TaxID=1398745 RepID=UPI0013ECAE4F|nr:C45 family peptidase [Litoribacterium kuwaitense]NGP44278.1 acyl-CoA--6-aminopenicillanic acid acyl-transferase [Litoribacterium kuwaitense]